jgi:hypothetical protein
MIPICSFLKYSRSNELENNHEGLAPLISKVVAYLSCSDANPGANISKVLSQWTKLPTDWVLIGADRLVMLVNVSGDPLESVDCAPKFGDSTRIEPLISG